MNRPTSSGKAVIDGDERLAHVEARLRVLRIYVICLFLLLGVFVMAVMIDAGLARRPISKPMVFSSGGAAMSLEAKDGAAGIMFRDENGKLRAVLGCTDEGSPRLTFLDALEKPRADFSLAGDNVVLRCFDRNLKQRAEMGVLSNKGYVLLLDEKGDVAFKEPGG